MVIAPFINEKAAELLPICVKTIGISYPQETVDRPRGAGSHHIFCVEAGEGVMETAEGNIALRPGMAIFIRAYAPVRYYGCGEKFESAWITFSGAGAEALLQYWEIEDFAFMQNDAIRQMIADCFHLAKSGACLAELSRCAYDILITYFCEYRASKKNPILIRAKRYAEEHYMNSVSVSDMARAAEMSESLLYRLFREEEGVSPGEYLCAVRIRYARQFLLSEPEMQIEQVAKCCGFSDASYFCKVFREKNGMAPGKYRKSFLL